MPRQAFHVYVKANEMASFWQKTALATDACHIGNQDDIAGKLLVQPCSYKAIVWGSPAGTANLISLCQQFGVTQGIFDDEGIAYTQFLTDLPTAYAALSGAGIGLCASPTGTVFDQIILNGQLATVVANCDSAYYQAEKKQESGAGWETLVANQVHAWQGLTAKPITVQLSVNPPANRTPTAAQVIADVDLVLGVCTPNDMGLFYTTTDADRISVAEEVFQHYMGGVVILAGVSRARRSEVRR